MLRIVWRPIQRLPPAAFQLRQQVIALRVRRINHPQIRVLPGPPRRHIRDLISARRPRPHQVPRLPIRQQRHIAARHVVPVKLIPLAAAHIFRKHNVLSAIRLKSAAAHRVREKRKLLPLAPRRLHQMQLRRIGKPSSNQHLPPRRTPVRQRRAPERPIPPSRLNQGSRNPRHPLHHQILRRRNHRLLRRSLCRRRGGRSTLRPTPAQTKTVPTLKIQANLLFIAFSNLPIRIAFRRTFLHRQRFRAQPSCRGALKRVPGQQGRERPLQPPQLSTQPIHIPKPPPSHAKIPVHSKHSCSRKS